MGTPTVTPLQEQRHDFGFIVSTDGPRTRSYDQGTLTGGTKVLAGTILGAAIAALVATSAVLGTNAGNGTVGSVSVQGNPATQVGTYTLVMTDATHFTVTAPDGQSATGTTGSAFSALGIGFTLTAGGTAFVTGDTFTFTVTGTPGIPTMTSTAGGSNTGNGTVGSTSVSGYAASVGVYTVEFDDATHFVVTAPNGQEIGHGTTGSAFKGGGLGFTITAGGTPFSPGDSFAITVGAGTGYYSPWDPANVDGSQIVAGILCATKDVTLANKPCAVLARAAEVNQSELIFPTGANAAVIAAAVAGLKAIGILCR
jgi:hypothetical protein